MSQYERRYRQVFIDAVKKADSSWEIGKPIKPGVLDGITREMAESGFLTDFSREFPRPLRRWDESASVVRCGYVLCDHIATADK